MPPNSQEKSTDRYEPGYPPPPPYHASMANTNNYNNNPQHGGGGYMPTDPSNNPQNSLNFFAMYGYNGNVSLAKGTNPHEVYGAIEKMRLVQTGRHDYDPSKFQRRIGNADDDDDEGSSSRVALPPPPPPDSNCNFCKVYGGPDKVRMISELKLEVCKECLREHWRADFNEFWANNDPETKKRRKQ